MKRHKKKSGKTESSHAMSGKIFILAGLLCILAAVLPQAMDRYREKKLLESLAELRRQEAEKVRTTQETPQEEGKLPEKETAAKDGAADSREPAPGAVLGSLAIPSIGLEAPIREGDQRASLKDALGHLPGTAPIGSETGNCAIAGHRNYTFGRFFNRLNEVEEGDDVLVTSPEGVTYTYEVTGIQVVDPEEISVADSDGSGKLTLITCTPIYIATHRLIVSCTLRQ